MFDGLEVVSVEIEWTPELIESFALETAKKYHIDEDEFVETLRCESCGFIDPKIQSGHYKNGVREQSFGIAQFNLPSGLKTASGEEITYEIAIDPEQAIDAAGYNFSIGLQDRWTCWRIKFEWQKQSF